jgi:hypothetical protein
MDMKQRKNNVLALLTAIVFVGIGFLMASGD